MMFFFTLDIISRYYNYFFGRACFIADLFKTEIAIPASESMEANGSEVMTFLFIIAVIGLLSLLMYFQTKKSHTFLKHPLWDKMYILMPVLFAISFYFDILFDRFSK